VIDFINEVKYQATLTDVFYAINQASRCCHQLSEYKIEGVSYISTMSVGINNDIKNKLKIDRL
jgi:hypothetical protein